MTPESLEELLAYIGSQIQKQTKNTGKYTRNRAEWQQNVILRAAPRSTACSVNTLIEISVLPFGGVARRGAASARHRVARHRVARHRAAPRAV